MKSRRKHVSLSPEGTRAAARLVRETQQTFSAVVDRLLIRAASVSQSQEPFSRRWAAGVGIREVAPDDVRGQAILSKYSR